MPGAAVAGQVHAEQAQLAEFGDAARGERAILEPVADVGEDPVGGEIAHRVADEALIGGQLVINPEQIDIAGMAAWPDG